MNRFNYIIGANSEFRIQLTNWSGKCIEYVNSIYGGDRSRIIGTKFGDCISKVEYIAFSIFDSSEYRGVKDDTGRLQAAAIVTIQDMIINEQYQECTVIESLTNAPWNVIDQPHQDNVWQRKGAATSLIEGIIKENKSKNLNTIIKALTLRRSKEFYQSIGFVETDYPDEMILTLDAADILVERQELRQSQPFD